MDKLKIFEDIEVPKGKPLPMDTYYYIIEPGSGREPFTGYVTIIK